MKKLLAIICVLACVGMLVGCAGDSDKKDETTAQTEEETVTNVSNNTETKAVPNKTTAAPTKKKAKETQTPKPAKKSKAKGGNIVGSWTFEGGIFEYTFNKDNSGVYKTGSESMYFTYKTVGNKVIINYKEGGKVTMPYTVKKDTLYLKDENGDDMPYYRSKK